MPLKVSISVGTGWTDVVAYIENLKETAKDSGFDIQLDTMPNSSYWDKWTVTTVGVTPWTHRPLGVMLLPLAYIGDKDGKPVPWNESRWIDEEFSTLLKKAQGTLDIEARKAIMKELERIQMERGSIAVAWWQNIWRPANPGFERLPRRCVPRLRDGRQPIDRACIRWSSIRAAGKCAEHLASIRIAFLWLGRRSTVHEESPILLILLH